MRELIRPQRVSVWGFPAVANFILGGAAAGFYLQMTLLEIITGNTFLRTTKLLAPLLTTIGLLVLLVEAGRPLRSYNTLRSLGNSWMSREGLLGAIFIFSAVLEWFFPLRSITLAAACSAVGFMVSQGLIIYCARAVISWNTPYMSIIFFTSGLASGFGLMLFLSSLGLIYLTPVSLAAGLVSLVLNMTVWLLYVLVPKDIPLLRATEALRSKAALARTVGTGHVIPLLLLLIPYGIANAHLFDITQRITSAMAAMAICVGTVSQKADLLLKTNYLRGIVMGSQKKNSQRSDLA